MKANLNQLSFTDIYSNIYEYFQQDKPKLIKLFEQHIDLQNLIPQSFYNHYHADTGHPRIYKLSSMISALILKSMLSIADTSLFINILNLSSELRDICGFTTVPNASQFSRFKIKFEKDLKNFFDYLVEITDPICDEINSYLNDILIVDTTGIEAYVNENNPKKFDTLLRQCKALSKNNPTFNAHSFACSKMPKVSYANPDIKLSYMNGHYCYALKTSIVTNDLGIIRDIDFLNDKSTNITEAATASEAKDTYDSKSLIPTLNKFFSKHDFKYKYFLGDAGFDAVDNYKYLYKDKNIRMHTVIPRNSSKWNNLYKTRTIIERTNFMMKYPLALQYTKLNNTESLKSEVILSAITQLIVVLIANNINNTQNILSIKKVIS